MKLGRGLGASVGGLFELGTERPRVLDIRGIWEFLLGADQKVFILSAHLGERFSSQNHFESSPSQIFLAELSGEILVASVQHSTSSNSPLII